MVNRQKDEEKEEEGQMILGIDHVQITVPKEDELKARQFYCEVLGLKEIEKPDNRKSKGGCWLAAGKTQVHLSLEDGVDRSCSNTNN